MKIRGAILLFILFIYGLASCSYGRDAIPDVLKEGALLSNIPFKEVILDPKSSIGRRVLLGGVIIETSVSQDKTTLVVLQKPVNRKDRPLQTDQSDGRFLVEWEGRFLDPAIYKEGREITVIGEITEERTEKIGEMSYRYPYVSASHIHLWQGRPYPPRYIYEPYPYWVGHPYYRYPFPYRYPYWNWPHRHPMILHR